MTNKLTNIWKIIGGLVLLLATFAAGYVVGSNQQKNSIEVPNILTSRDMEHAFGSAKALDHEPLHEASTQEPQAMSLNSLVAGLEKKVATNPENIDQTLLLAQTYNELGSREKGLALLRKLNKQSPGNAQVKITLATVLMKGTDKQELKEALQTFDEAIKLKPETAKMARMYQDEIKARLNKLGK